MHLVTARFANATGKKKTHPVCSLKIFATLLINYDITIAQNFKVLRTRAVALLSHASSILTPLVDEVGDAERRKEWNEGRQGSSVVTQVSMRLYNSLVSANESFFFFSFQ